MPVAAITGGLTEFQMQLIGTWTNQVLPNATNGEGGTTAPLSYNVMPLPQAGGNGYILKNFTLYETVKFNSKNDVAQPATAPNRGDNELQAPTALFYDQQVLFAEGPGMNTVVHVENGAWLNLATEPTPLDGPYPDGFPGDNPPNAAQSIAKQMSVPHGNSILALGTFDGPTSGAPTIPDSTSVLPTPAGLDTTPYSTLLDNTKDYQNPQPVLTVNPNKVLQKAVGIINPTNFIHWSVNTDPAGHAIDIPFEERAANVTAYSADYWLLSTDGGSNYTILAYTQNITMKIPIGGVTYDFPHVTTNVVTKS